MKSVLSTLLFTTLAASTPTPRDASNASTDMDAVIAGTITCASNAIIFGRGTFDSGNMGAWVGPFLKEGALKEFNGDVHVQGVNAADYPASLEDYVESGGSVSCAESCAGMIEAYTAKCPKANIFVSGWSQGALCAHQCINRLSPATLTHVKGLTTFGDENALMDNPSTVPGTVPFKTYCVQDNLAPDPLCTSTLTPGFRLPSSLEEFKRLVIEPLDQLKDVAQNGEQVAAALKLPVQLLSGFMGVLGYFVEDVAMGKVRRWMVLPPHFLYGNNGMAGDSAVWMAGLTRGK